MADVTKDFTNLKMPDPAPTNHSEAPNVTEGEAQPVDMINHPPHYTRHPSGVECVDVAEHYNFNVGNAIKYLWRHKLKNDPIEDLKKARWYIDREIAKREKEAARDA